MFPRTWEKKIRRKLRKKQSIRRIKLKKIKFKKNLLLTSKEKSIIIKDTVRLSVVNVN